MQVPLEITYNHISQSDWIDEYIKERAEHLDSMCDNLISCRVTIERVQHSQHTGNIYRAQVEASLPPKKHLVGDKKGVVEDMHVQLRSIIRKAFEAVEKQLKKETARRRGDMKQHENSYESHAFVVRLFSDEGYGFIKSPIDGQEYYFHRNAVLHDDFERLHPGTQVRFEAEMGEKGPQASTVQVIDKPGVHVPEEGEEAIEQPDDWKKQ